MYMMGVFLATIELSSAMIYTRADLGGSVGCNPPNESEQPHPTTERPSIAWAQ